MLNIMAPKFKTNRKKDLEETPPFTVHPWRLCPLGQYWRKETRAYVRKSGPVKSSAPRCQHNPSKKDQIYSEELIKIAEQHFADLKGPPKSDNLDKNDGNNFESFIRGWTKYWNEVLKPDEPLDPDLVKAIIRTESGFNTKATNNSGRAGKARGLMQITDEPIKVLAEEKGELKDHLVNVDQKEMSNPNLNIAAGIRWLHRKKEIQDARGKSSWLDAVAAYKAHKTLDHPKMKEFIAIYERLKK